jgi:hypothetical protein
MAILTLERRFTALYIKLMPKLQRAEPFALEAIAQRPFVSGEGKAFLCR